MSDFVETEHPRDEGGQFTDLQAQAGPLKPPAVRRPRKPKAASNLPKRQPLSVTVANPDKAKANIKGKYVPRDPKEGEEMLLLKRPQAGAYLFTEYAVGDLIQAVGGLIQTRYVVTAAKPGYTRSGEGWKLWEQLVIARLATEEDIAAVADQAAAQRAEDRMIDV